MAAGRRLGRGECDGSDPLPPGDGLVGEAIVDGGLPTGKGTITGENGEREMYDIV